MRHSHKIYQNLQNSINGFHIGLKEHSFAVEFLLGVLLIPILLLTHSHDLVFYLLIVSYFMLLSVELLNTAIERICNKITLEYDDDIKAVKDLSSAAVFILVILNGVLLITILLGD